MILPRRYPVLFNPKARSQRGRRALEFLMDNAAGLGLYATRSAEEAEALSRRFADQGEDIVIAAGGDGTLNAVVKGLAGSRTALGVLPTGTMNVFARELGIPYDNLDRAFEVILEGHVREVDLFEANGTPFVQMAGVGFDAAVIEETTWESKKVLGPLAYLLSAVKVLGETPPLMKVIADDGREEEGVAVLAGNGSLYGGQFKLFHKADNTDNKLDVLVFKEAGYKLVLDSLRGIAMGGVDFSNSTVEYFQTERLEVTANRMVPLEVDGELVGRTQHVIFKDDQPERLRVLAPRQPIGTRFEESLKAMMSWTKKTVGGSSM
ncbi:diacylglycerol/lipid kinase family protein [Haloferula chungangensis]|uniref:Diacylglycerol/lipid kinase family protein n=1 Tax=Haloferula chungangensis TaxID=1048331 RepID=A0ABW2L7G3_9BACT